MKETSGKRIKTIGNVMTSLDFDKIRLTMFELDTLPYGRNREGRKERNTDSQEGQLDDSQPMRGMQMGGRDAEVTYGREENAGDAQGRDETEVQILVEPGNLVPRKFLALQKVLGDIDRYLS